MSLTPRYGIACEHHLKGKDCCTASLASRLYRECFGEGYNSYRPHRTDRLPVDTTFSGTFQWVCGDRDGLELRPGSGKVPWLWIKTYACHLMPLIDIHLVPASLPLPTHDSNIYMCMSPLYPQIQVENS